MAAAGSGSSSRFAATCGLLCQYMREQQQLVGSLDGAFRLPPLVETTDKDDEDADGRTMQLFPTRAGTLQQSSQERPEAQAKAPLTIMYEGRVLVFEDFPADKAEELMQMAGSGSQKNKGEPAAQEKPATNNSPAAPALPDLPIARKASLQRFLQKRRHRISATEPYNKVTASPVHEAKDVAGSGKPAASWLGL
ncbi:unnamed protein product [Urochloa decumbens]|uniref:Protein TIFY n=1 Tax=Urochloa decumbens TaxID=240449 RepID=A0ABC8XZ13_9POAL